MDCPEKIFFGLDIFCWVGNTEALTARKVDNYELDYWELFDGDGEFLTNAIFTPDGAGLDLKIGGEGMKGFYDKMMGGFLKKYVKK